MNRQELTSRLAAMGIASPEAEAQWILAEKKPKRIEEWIARRGRFEPLQYILGTTEFYGCRIAVDRRVLIPRPETEGLVEEALRLLNPPQSPFFKGGGPVLPPFVKGGRGGFLSILDIGTGSGCIAIALAKELPTATIVATDISAEALTLARENATMNRVAGRITFVECDLFPDEGGPFDLIVSNPPYIPSSVIPTLMPEVRDWEPHGALDGGPDGLAVIRRIVTQAPRFVKTGGSLVLEIGEDQVKGIKTLVAETPAFSSLNIVNDLTGRPRIALAMGRQS